MPDAIPNQPAALSESELNRAMNMAPKVMLVGDTGTGKTDSLKSLIRAGITPFVVATEQNFLQVMRVHLGKEVHFKYVNVRPEHSWGQLEDMAKKINMLSYENLTKVSDPFKQAHNKFIDLFSICNKFVCDCCKKDWGSVNGWNTDRAFVIDSLSGISDMAFGLVVGNKPVRAQPDYQVAQNAIRMLLGPLTAEIRCMFVLISHLDREKDEITGGTYLTARTVGQKLGPALPPAFSDVIRARRVGTTFVWDTADTQATVVGRHVLIRDSLPADFGPLIKKWVELGGVISPTV